jgi:hypothetical protein
MNTLSKYLSLLVLPVTITCLSGCKSATAGKSAGSPEPAGTTAAAKPAEATPAAADAKPAPAPVMQEVDIRSTPSDANVAVNDFFVGKTPLAADMSTQQSYVVKITKPGFRIATFNIRPVTTLAHFSKFGTASVTRTAPKLAPSSINVTLQPVKDPYGEMVANVAIVDAKYKAGKITLADHNRQVAEIVTIYSAAPAASN